MSGAGRTFDLSDTLRDLLAASSALAHRRGLTLRFRLPEAALPRLRGEDAPLRRTLRSWLEAALENVRGGELSLQAAREFETDSALGLRLSLGGAQAFPPMARDGLLGQARETLLELGGIAGSQAWEGGSALWCAVRLPKAPGGACAPCAEPERSFHVLAVEPGLRQRGELCREFEGLGVTCHVAARPLEALTALERVPCGLILLDLDDTEGADRLAAEIPRRGKGGLRPRILGMSRSPSQEMQRSAAVAGLDGVLLKPVAGEALARSLARWDGPLDQDRLRLLVELGAPEPRKFLGLLAEAFSEGAAAHLEAMKEALERGDREGLERGAHALKSDGGSIGARAVASLCARLERLLPLGALAEAPRIVEALGAELERVREGLRETRERLPEAAAAVSAAAPQGESTWTVLLCDDDLTLLQMIQRLLERRGHRCLLADGADEALALASSTRPDLLVLDLDLDHRSGFDVLKELRERGGVFPRVLILTNHEDAEKHARARSLGAEGVLVKPFDPGLFLEQARRTMESGPSPAHAR